MEINYKSDFKVLVTPKVNNTEVDLTDHDFDLIFTTSGGSRKYTCSRRGDEFVNCRFEGTKILCVFDNHHLGAGRLSVLVRDIAPDGSYPDGNKTTCAPTELDIWLVVGAGDGVHVEVDVVMDIATLIANAEQAIAAAGDATESAVAAAERAEAAADEVDVVIGRASGYADAAAASAREAREAAHQAQVECEGAHGYMVNAKAFADNAAASASQAAGSVSVASNYANAAAGSASSIAGDVDLINTIRGLLDIVLYGNNN